LQQILPYHLHPDAQNLSENPALALQRQEAFLVMSWNDTSPRLPLKLLESLSALEPCGVISSQPALWDAIAPVFDNVAMIADEEEGAAVWHIDLHTDQAICVSWEVMQRDALTEVHILVGECLPV